MSPSTRAAVRRHAREQGGVVSHGQVFAAGGTRSQIRGAIASGDWQRLLPGVYLTHGGPVPYPARIWAALLYAGRGAMASHETAAYLLYLTAAESDAVHVTVPAGRHVTPQPGVVIHRSRRPVRGRVLPRSSPPRTTVEETVLDIADAATLPDAVVAVIANACRLRRTTPAALARALQSRSRFRWRALAADVFAAAGNGVESPLEYRYLHDVERAHGLPRGERQVLVRSPGRSGTHRRDVHYKAFRVVVELDGRAGHEEGAFRDMARDNRNAVLGESTLRYGFGDVAGRACGAARQVGTMLQRGGWAGRIRRCGPGCTAVGP